MTSCAREPLQEPNIHQNGEYSIPIETALSSLEDFMKERGVVETKGDFDGLVSNYFTVSGTKSSGGSGDILYAVNFTDEGGYALLSADSRIQEEIIAVVDTGSVSESDFAPPLLMMTPSEDDDLSMSEYNEMVSSGVLATLENSVNFECLQYASNQIQTYHYDDFQMVGSPCDPTRPGWGGSGPEIFEWKVAKEVPRLINTAWTQSTPFHDIFDKYTPDVGLINRERAPAGCVCIAVSQIVAFHEFPDSLECNGVKVNYSQIKGIMPFSYRNYVGPLDGQDMLAKFTYCIGGMCNTLYFKVKGKTYGFAWPWDAQDCLSSLGYRNVGLNWGYDEDKVLGMLDNGCPVFMSAISGCIDGHAWVVDGYIKRVCKSNLGTIGGYQTLVHCNWGWLGDYNGYFTSGLFRPRDVMIKDFEEEFGEEDDSNFQYRINTITYDKPRN